MSRASKVLHVALALLPVSGQEVQGQTTRADSMAAFVEAVFSHFMFGAAEEPSVRLADLPAGFPVASLPGNARVMGSVAFRPLTLTIFESDSADAVVAELGSALQNDGWVRHSLDPDANHSYSGMSQPLTYCRDRMSVTLGSSPEQGKVSVFHIVDQEMSTCTALDRAHDQTLSSPIPRLRPPVGAREMGGSGSGGTDEWSQSIRLATEQGLEELRDHYVQQLQTYGAEIGSAVRLDDVLMVGIRLADKAGDHWRGVVSVEAPRTGSRLIRIVVARVSH